MECPTTHARREGSPDVEPRWCAPQTSITEFIHYLTTCSRPAAFLARPDGQPMACRRGRGLGLRPTSCAVCSVFNLGQRRHAAFEGARGSNQIAMVGLARPRSSSVFVAIRELRLGDRVLLGPTEQPAGRSYATANHAAGGASRHFRPAQGRPRSNRSGAGPQAHAGGPNARERDHGRIRYG